jgi:hypothetical protein
MIDIRPPNPFEQYEFYDQTGVQPRIETHERYEKLQTYDEAYKSK